MSESNFSFRIATAEDTLILKQLIESAFRAEDTRQGWVGIQKLASGFSIEEKQIASGVADPNTVFLIARDEHDHLLGTIGASKRGSEVARLFMLAVDPRFHRGGTGRAILDYAEQYCKREWKSRVISLDALSTRESLIAWYLRRGYRQTGETNPFPREKCEELDLPEDLHFVEFEKEV
ncbi:Uncharacterized protein PECH_005762 [Penicillium ucsense]|uniref:N-acetyltransferase domain-containing protein n=1 Tax=Penicillium ucsense TaxID=2839758 RepID=A0A8J8W4Z3_9EURO|nr:Uncharacterized protein PECM_006221 [Penicillium ucsense]KAF7736174.1 Uncharacterized protein PECH_005762 [Penicillium ucsense]